MKLSTERFVSNGAVRRQSDSRTCDILKKKRNVGGGTLVKGALGRPILKPSRFPTIVNQVINSILWVAIQLKTMIPTTVQGITLALVSTTMFALINALDPSLSISTNWSNQSPNDQNHHLRLVVDHNGSLAGFEHIDNIDDVDDVDDIDDVGDLLDDLFDDPEEDKWWENDMMWSTNESMTTNGSRISQLNGSLVSDSLFVTSIYGNRACSGIPFGIIYSNYHVAFQDDRCHSGPGTAGVSINNDSGVKDGFADAIQRFGCNVSFVMLGAGENCEKAGTKRPGGKVVSFWVAMQADNVCHQTPGLGGLDFDDDDYDDNNQFENKHHHKHHKRTTSVKVKLQDNQLQITSFKDADCQLEDDSITIDGRSKPVIGDSLFCEDEELYRIYDASGKSTLFNTNVSVLACKKQVVAGTSSKSHASDVSLSLQVALITLVSATVLHL